MFSIFDKKSRAIAKVFKYSTEVASSHLRPPRAVLWGWNVQGMKAVNPPVSCCRSYDMLEVIYAVLERFAHPEHHGRRRAHTNFVGGAMDVKPVFGDALQARDLVSHFIVENLRPAARNRL